MNELTPDTVLQSTSGKDFNSTKDTAFATSKQDEAIQGDKGKKRKMSTDSKTSTLVSKSETDSKRKEDDSIDPTVPHENLEKHSQVEQNTHQE